MLSDRLVISQSSNSKQKSSLLLPPDERVTVQALRYLAEEREEEHEGQKIAPVAGLEVLLPDAELDVARRALLGDDEKRKPTCIRLKKDRLEWFLPN